MRSPEGRIEQVEHIVVAMAVSGISLYKAMLSPVLPRACRYDPTCSRYAVGALKKHGLWKGLGLAAKRILRCHPLGGSGFDPVP
jgi:putative membrane protein insertion efficiency factor